ncbi:MAG: hypothetical protein J6B37_08985 [Clostridia bacterium]|nr:hypothetical protein [Clostridia bacterium]
MSKKIKKYIFLIPTLIVMLLNCFCYGQFVYAADSIDYSYLFLDPQEKIPHILAKGAFNSVDFSSNFSHNNVFDNYYYQVVSDITETDQYLNGEIDYLNFTIIYINLTDVELITNGDSYTCSSGLQCFVRYYKYNKTYAAGWIFEGRGGIDGTSNRHFWYFTPANGFFEHKSAVASTGNTPYELSDIVTEPNFYTWYLDTNSLDLDGSKLDVSVIFNPDLSGVVDRSVTLDDGSTALKNSLNMIIRNNSKFDIQYSMSIYRKEDYPEIGGTAPGVYPVFRYFTKDWVYGNSLDNSAAYFNSVEKQNKATASHLLWSGRTDTILFDYNQLPLSEGVEYTVVVTATRNDYKYASEIIVPSYEDIYPDLFQVYQQEIVFRSDFIMKQYSDVKYDRNNTNNGVLPYQGKDDYSAYENSYYAKEDSDGNIDYEGKDVYNDPDSWYNDKFNHDIDFDKAYPGLVGDKESGGSSDGTFTSFASSFTNYFQFLSFIFNYFPVGIKNVFLIGFVGIMAVVLLKVVFKS